MNSQDLQRISDRMRETIGVILTPTHYEYSISEIGEVINEGRACVYAVKNDKKVAIRIYFFTEDTKNQITEKVKTLVELLNIKK